MTNTQTSQPATPPAAFALIISTLLKLFAGACYAHAAAGELAAPIYFRIARLTRRFADLIMHGPAPMPTEARPAAPASAKPKSPAARPAGLGWLKDFVPEALFDSFRSGLYYLMTEPEMADLLATYPGLDGVLRSFCGMFGIRCPPTLRRPRTSRPKPRLSEQPEPTQAEPTAPAPEPAAPPAFNWRKWSPGAHESRPLGPINLKTT